MGLLSPSISTLALCLGLVNLGILYHAGVPVPPEPYLSLLGILIMNLMLFVKIPSVLGILADRQSGNQGHTTAGDPPLDLGRRDFVAEYKRLNTLCWTRYIVALQTWATLILKASVKDGRYSITVNRTLYDFVIGVGAGLLMFSAFVLTLAMNDERRKACSAQSAEDAKSLPPKPYTEEERDSQKEILAAEKGSHKTEQQ